MTYLGSLSTWYLPDEMFELFKRLQLVKDEPVFLIITKEDPYMIQHIAEKHGVDMRCVKVVSAERRELPALLNLSTFAVSFVKPSYSKIASSPTKIGEYLCMGIPVLCNTGIGDSDILFNSPEAGVLCSDFNTETYDNCISEMLESLNTYTKKNVRAVGIKYFSLADGVNQYARMYAELTKS
jgi:glycosyltransferase involved in cell wall biosynthesis